MTLISDMADKALQMGIPISVHLDVTYRCNERCEHCYLEHDDKGELTTREIKTLLDQLAEAGVFFLTLSGGEVFMRRDFLEIIEYARNLQFNVKIKTNGVMIRDREAQRLRELGVEEIQISIYSHRPEVHDAIAERTPSAPFVDDGPPLIVRHELGQWYLDRGDFQVQWDAVARRGKIAQTPNPYSIDTILRIVHSLILAGEGGFLLHGASAIRNGKAFLFSGVSGAGKTTISRLAPPDATILTDEISYIRLDGDSYRACGTPFAGELARVGENAQAPVEQLFFLAQGPENRIDPIRHSDALRMLLRNILFFANDSSLVESVFDSANQFLQRVPVSRLTFYPDVHVWDLIG